MSVNWHNVIERLISTTVQAVVGAAAASAEAVATHQVDWVTALTGVAVAGLLSLAKNLQVELSTPDTPSVPDVPANVPLGVPSDTDRAALTLSDNK